MKKVKSVIVEEFWPIVGLLVSILLLVLAIIYLKPYVESFNPVSFEARILKVNDVRRAYKEPSGFSTEVRVETTVVTDQGNYKIDPKLAEYLEVGGLISADGFSNRNEELPTVTRFEAAKGDLEGR